MNLLAALFMAQLLYVIGVGGVQVRNPPSSGSTDGGEKTSITPLTALPSRESACSVSPQAYYEAYCEAYYEAQCEAYCEAFNEVNIESIINMKHNVKHIMKHNVKHIMKQIL
jgi:hypothetical protein